jgi:hypothetical protein
VRRETAHRYTHRCPVSWRSDTQDYQRAEPHTWTMTTRIVVMDDHLILRQGLRVLLATGRVKASWMGGR